MSPGLVRPREILRPVPVEPVPLEHFLQRPLQAAGALRRERVDAVLVDDALEDPVLARRSGRYSPPLNEGCRRPSAWRSVSLGVGEGLGIEGGADRLAASIALEGGDDMGVVGDRPEVALRLVAKIDDGPFWLTWSVSYLRSVAGPGPIETLRGIRK